MMLKKISLTNFASFYGEHTFQFEAGINFIEGPGASGKTNLAGALGFAVFGRWERHFTRYRCPRAALVNHVHREESENPFCEVNTDLEHARARIKHEIKAFHTSLGV